MTRIVTTHYRYKRPPRKRAKAAAIEAPAIVTASKRPKVSMRIDTSDEARTASGGAKVKNFTAAVGLYRMRLMASPAGLSWVHIANLAAENGFSTLRCL